MAMIQEPRTRPATRRHRRASPDEATAPAPASRAASDLATGAVLFRSLGDPSRLTILQHLLTGEHRVVDLTDHLGLAQSTVSTHLACLRDCGLVTSRPDGRATQWSLVAPERVVALLTAAEDLLGTTGDRVALCPTSGAGR